MARCATDFRVMSYKRKPGFGMIKGGTLKFILEDMPAIYGVTPLAIRTHRPFVHVLMAIDARGECQPRVFNHRFAIRSCYLLMAV
jgi:hypothetical protein